MPAEAESERPSAASDANTRPDDPPQCRICLDGEDPELGRLIRPCLCKGSVSVSSTSSRRLSWRAYRQASMCM
jgi:E3 ubiquitin-protein ligase DOA10